MDSVEVKKIRKSFRKAQEYAGNSACVKAGQDLLKKAREDKVARDKAGERSTYNAALDAAHYLVGQARGRISIQGGYTYCCFDCLHHLTNTMIQGKRICVQCQNGYYFQKKRAN
jgi:hypothetical protein